MMKQASLVNPTPGRHLPRCSASPNLSPRMRFCILANANRHQSYVEAHAKVEEHRTYLGEKLRQIQPSQQLPHADYTDLPAAESAPQILLKSLNHAALEAVDVPSLTAFYTAVLGFRSMDRPEFPFGGSWLEGAGMLLHIIQEDPSVPKQLHDWKDKYAEQPPKTWYIRRANHLAFEVEDADVMEARLIYYGITYTKAVVPGVNAAQLFFFDPEGNGVEVGCDYGKVADMLRSRASKHSASNNGAAASP